VLALRRDVSDISDIKELMPALIPRNEFLGYKSFETSLDDGLHQNDDLIIC